MITEPILIDLKYIKDDRGLFYESYKKSFLESFGIVKEFVQDNYSISKKNTLRGLHYQWDKPMDKLIRVSHGAIQDILVNIKKDSQEYGKIYYYNLSADEPKLLYAPSGYAHGFVALVNNTHVAYKCTNEYNKEGESGINPLDSNLNVQWNIDLKNAIISEKDKNLQSFFSYCLNSKF